MRLVHLALILAGVATFAGRSVAADFVKPDALRGGLPAVTGAQPASPDAWPATRIFLTPGGGCTATVVGARVVLTAAHCVADGEAGTVELPGGPAPITCDHHPGYRLGNVSTDFALCHASADFSGFAFENVSASLAHARPGAPVTLLGYGCVEPGGFDRSFGVLHSGVATVTAGPFGDNAYTVTQGGAALCFGDSGGAAYYTTVQTLDSRVVIGVNSRGDINTLSYLSSTATPTFVEWALGWAATRSLAICGLHAQAKGCRP